MPKQVNFISWHVGDGRVGNSETSEIFFQIVYIRVFGFGYGAKSKARNNISEISEFSICHFLFT